MKAHIQDSEGERRIAGRAQRETRSRVGHVESALHDRYGEKSHGEMSLLWVKRTKATMADLLG